MNKSRFDELELIESLNYIKTIQVSPNFSLILTGSALIEGNDLISPRLPENQPVIVTRERISNLCDMKLDLPDFFVSDILTAQTAIINNRLLSLNDDANFDCLKFKAPMNIDKLKYCIAIINIYIKYKNNGCKAEIVNESNIEQTLPYLALAESLNALKETSYKLLTNLIV